MSRHEGGGTSKKIDVILGGMETIGRRTSRCRTNERHIATITDGAYSNLLYELFTLKNV